LVRRRVPLLSPAIPVYVYSNHEASACRLFHAIGPAVTRYTDIRKIRSCWLFIGSPPLVGFRTGFGWSGRSFGLQRVRSASAWQHDRPL